MEKTKRARFDLALKVLPGPLLKAILEFFVVPSTKKVLVGGTALAGFYAGHRRSDDIDLFVADEKEFKATLQCIDKLKDLGVQISEESHYQQYYHALCQWKGHIFTVDIVEDKNLFVWGEFEQVKENIIIPTLKTLLALKAATLVSRCSEKDLYDLLWIFEQSSTQETILSLIEKGQKVDAGLSFESALASLSEALLKKESCNFSLSPQVSGDDIYRDIKKLQNSLIKEISNYLRKQPLSPLSQLAKKVKEKTR